MQNPLKNKWQQKWISLDCVHPQIQTLADAAQEFCANWLRNNTERCVLVLHGNSGSGKTHVSKKIFQFCRAASMNAFETKGWGNAKLPESIFQSWPELCRVILGTKFFVSVNDLLDTDTLFLDDIGAENDPFETCKDVLCQILSRRERKFTVITTNIAPANWSQRFDLRICDRLFRNSTIVDLSNVPSYSMK